MSFSKVRRANGLLFVSSEVAHSPEGHAHGGVAQQTAKILEHLSRTLKDEGLTLDDVVQVTAFMPHPEDFASFDEVYKSHFRLPYPVRTTVVTQLLYPGACVEMQVVAAQC